MTDLGNVRTKTEFNVADVVPICAYNTNRTQGVKLGTIIKAIDSELEPHLLRSVSAATDATENTITLDFRNSLSESLTHVLFLFLKIQKQILKLIEFRLVQQKVVI